MKYGAATNRMGRLDTPGVPKMIRVDGFGQNQSVNHIDWDWLRGVRATCENSHFPSVRAGRTNLRTEYMPSVHIFIRIHDIRVVWMCISACVFECVCV